MKNLITKHYLTTAIITITLFGLLGCTPDPESNHKPVVTVPKDRQIDISESITLTATASDPDKEDILTYKWRVAAKPKESHLSLKNDTNKTVTFKADTIGTYYLDFIAKDSFVSSDPKRVTIKVSSLIGEWKADLSTTKKENKLNEDEKIEVVETLSSKYKFNFLENGKVEGDDSASWRYSNDSYKLNDTKIEMIDSNKIAIDGKLKNNKEVKFYYKRVIKKITLL